MPTTKPSALRPEEILQDWKAFYTTAEYARIFRLPPSTVAYLCSTGGVKASRHGRAWRIPASFVHEQMRSAEQ